MTMAYEIRGLERGTLSVLLILFFNVTSFSVSAFHIKFNWYVDLVLLSFITAYPYVRYRLHRLYQWQLFSNKKSRLTTDVNQYCDRYLATARMPESNLRTLAYSSDGHYLWFFAKWLKNFLLDLIVMPLSIVLSVYFIFWSRFTNL
ncbi:MAG: hypothetical protein ABF723_07805 [Lentilactobacillus hilgardii]|uniref:hypothetical protein n=1 Tax=Lentilactobacillus hilgardii TaxID=1588 RepID=UPI001CC1EDC0|nr:hypothetical protein [Lentilactobacillus hilgardii]MBZ2200654.1 hypothetical protein [Lentilactobacillus hilgardii]MBZ2203323.1 hypothetical protein [Lentilactobacillus hilgardii]